MDNQEQLTANKIGRSIRMRFYLTQIIVIVIVGLLTILALRSQNILLTESEILTIAVISATVSTLIAVAIWFISYYIIAKKMNRQIMNDYLKNQYTLTLRQSIGSLSLHIVYFISMLVIVSLFLNSRNARRDIQGLSLYKADPTVVRLVDSQSIKQINRFYQAKPAETEYLGSHESLAYFKVNQYTISIPLAKVQFYDEDSNSQIETKNIIRTYQLTDQEAKSYLKTHIFLIQAGYPTVSEKMLYQKYQSQPNTKVYDLDIK